MKKITSTFALILLFSIVLFNKDVKANPGDSCTSAITLTVGSASDYAFQYGDTALWFSFVADSSNMSITIVNPVMPADTPFAYTKSMAFYYGPCSSLVQNGIQNELLYSDTLFDMEEDGLTIGQTYYVRLTKYSTAGCRICNAYPSYVGIIVQSLLSTFPLIVPCNNPVCGPNLICNGDFQAWGGGPPPAWYLLPTTGCPNVTTQMIYANTPCLGTLLGGGQDVIMGLANGCIPTPGLPPGYASWVDSPYPNNGFCPGPEIAWEQNPLTVINGATYQFSAWFSNLDPVNARYGIPQINMLVNGVGLNNMPIAPQYINPAAPIWNQILYCWQATSTTANLVISANCLGNGVGFDFQFDDIAFQMTDLPIVKAKASAYLICNGNSVTLSVISPIIPGATYVWSPAGGSGTSVVVTPTVTTTYTVTESYDGCSATASVKVGVDAPIVTITSSTNVTCNGGTDGSATATASGGTTPYHYKWTTSPVQTTATATGLSAGTYTVTVTDGLGCTTTASVTITQPTPITISLSGNTLVCLPTGTTTMTASASGGNPGYNYTWTPGGQTNATATGLSIGTYTVTATDASGCTATALCVIQQDMITPTMITTETCIGSSNGTATVSVSGGISPYFYLWAPGGQTTSIITGLSAGTYTVTVTDINGCTATASGTITVDNLSVTIAGYPNNLYASLACQNSPAWYCPVVMGGVGPYTYDWSNTIGGSTSTYISPCIDVTWASTALGGEVILKVTDANGCSAMDTFLVRGCCPGTTCQGLMVNNFDINYPNVTLQSFHANNCEGTGCPVISYSVSAGWRISGFIPTAPIIINGILNIDVDTYFQYCDVLMGTNAKIVVHSGNTLTIDACHFHSCANMWQNITIEAGATLNIIDGSLMEDAEEAVLAANKLLTYPYTPGNSIYYLDQSIFNKNYIGVAVWADALNTNSSPYPSTISGCTFSCDVASGTPLPCNTFPGWTVNTTPISLIPPYLNYRGAYGVAIDQVDYIDVGGASGSSTNIFQDIDQGVFSQKSITSVLDDNFYNMMTVVGPPFNNVPAIPLAGVYALGDNTNVYDLLVGGTTLNACLFNQCNYGVWVFNGNNATINYNTISGFPVMAGAPMSRGVYLDNNISSISLNWTLNVDYNSITNEWIGIDNFSNINSQIYIKNNPIISSNANVNWATSFGVRINEPMLSNAYYDVDPYNTINQVANGVVAVNVQGAYIGYNTINMTGLGFANEGVILKNSGYSLINENNITAPIATNSDGIRLTFPSLRFDGVTCNTTTNNWQGIYIGGNQTPGIDIRNNTMNIPNIAVGCGLYLKQVPALGFIGIQGGSGNYIVKNYYSNWNTIGPSAATNSGILGNGFVVDQPPPFIYDPNLALDWGGGLRVMFTVIPFGTSNPNCNPPSILPEFLAPAKAEVLRLIVDSFPYTGYAQTAHWSDKYSIYHYLNDVDKTHLMDSSLAILHFVDSVRHGNIGSLDSINKLLVDTAGLSPTDLTIAQSLNSALTSPDTAETELQKYYNILISIYSAGQSIPQGTQVSTLQNIAVLCPDQYGPAVYFARALLSPVDTTNYSDNCGMETDNEHKLVKKKTSSSSNSDNTLSGLSALVYPNPANTLLNVALFSSPGQEAQLQGKIEYLYVYNQMGELVMSYQLTNSLTTVSVTALSQGIYHYRIVDDTQKLIKTSNVIIVR